MAKVEIRRLKYPEGKDHLRLVRILCIDIYRNNYVRLFLMCAFATHLTFILLQGYYFLKISGTSYFIQYAPMYFFSSFGLAAMYAALYLSDTLTKVLSSLEMWDCLSETCREDHRRECRFLTGFVVYNTCFMIVSFLILFHPGAALKEIFYLHSLVENLIGPGHDVQVTLGILLSCIFFAVISGSGPYSYIYGAIHLKYQVVHRDSLQRLLLNADRHYENKVHLLENRQFQCDIAQSVKTITRRQQQIRSCARTLKDRSKSWILMHTLLFVMAGISLSWFVFSGDNNFGNLLKISPILCSGGLIGIVLLSVGQQAEDMTVKTYDLLFEHKWYYWNASNRKSYLIMLANSFKPFKLGILSKIAVNYETGATVVRSIYAIASVLRKIFTD